MTEEQKKVRARTLLQATCDFLGQLTLDDLSHTVEYDEAECDGLCLREDINDFLSELDNRSEMKPCKYCGKQPVLLRDFTDECFGSPRKFVGYFVACTNRDCGSVQMSSVCTDKDKAIASWNKLMGK